LATTDPIHRAVIGGSGSADSSAGDGRQSVSVEQPAGNGAQGHEYRVDELARMAGTTVRNLRAYQDRGLLPPSRREGRVALYSDSHLARLKVIAQLLERGYTLSNIGELIAAWESGQNVGDLLGLEAVLAAPWTDETPMLISETELATLFGNEVSDREGIDLALELGMIEIAPGHEFDSSSIESEAIEASGERSEAIFLVPRPRMLNVGAELVAAGIPLKAVLALGATLREDIDRVARNFVALTAEHVFDPVGEPIPADQVPRITEVVRRLRPLAKEAVDVELADAMERHVSAELRHRLDRMLEEFKRSQSEAS
jgi:DNA-binding transcriptional MerR regulator